MTQRARLDENTRRKYIEMIRKLPKQVAEFVAPLRAEQLTTQYLDGEWSVAQNVHHLADSHMNSYIRLKLILTEERPTVRPYDQDAWAVTPEANSPDLGASLELLAGLHRRWADLFASLKEDQWLRTGLHPASGEITPETLLESYAAHGEAHLDQMRRTLAAAHS